LNLVFASGFLFPQRLLRHDYFRGVRAMFPGACFPRVPLTGSIDARARALADEIARFRFPDPDGPIHVVGHSMGGLDARHMISRLGMDAQVQTLVTLGTPHRGSPVADRVFDLARRVRLLEILERLADAHVADGHSQLADHGHRDPAVDLQVRGG